jgi:hypothetical protein
MIRKSIRVGLPLALSIGLLALAASRSSAQVKVLGGQQLGNCEVEIRPKGAPKLMVYWEERQIQNTTTTPPTTDYELEFTVDTMMDDKIHMRDRNATATTDLPAKRDRQNIVKFKWNRSAGTMSASISNGVATPVTYTPTYEGTFDPLLLPTDPTYVNVDTGDANPDHDRIRVTGQFRGMTVAWTAQNF